MSSKQVLFVTYGAGHADIVRRLVGQIKSRNDLDFKVLALTTAAKLFDEHQVNYSQCRDYLHLNNYAEAAQIGGKLSEGLWNPDSGIPFAESAAYMGVSMLDLIAQHGHDKAMEMYQEQGRKAFCPVRFMQQVLTQLQPDLVVTTCYVRMEKAAVLAAKALGIKSVLIEDLFGYSMLGEKPLHQNQLVDELVHLPDELIVLNNSVRDRLIDAGYPPEQVLALGQPVFADWAKDYESLDIEPGLRAFAESPNPVITYATPARRDVLYSQSPHFLELAKQNPDWQVIIKLHPSVPSQEFSEKYPQLPANLYVCQGESIESAVKISDIVVIFRSSVGLLCLFCGVPLLVLDATGEDQFMPYASSGAADALYDNAQLTPYLRRFFSERVINQEKQQHPLFENPEHAAQAIVAHFAKQH